MKSLLYTFLCLAASFEFGLGDISFVASVIQKTALPYKCNAFFVSDIYLVTTGNCVMCNKNCQYQVKLRSKNPADDYYTFDVEHITLHPKFYENPIVNNIAVLKLSYSPNNIIVYKVSNKTDLTPGREGHFFFWGYTPNGSTYKVQEAKGMHVTDKVYRRATDLRLQPHEIGIKSHSPVSTSRFDEGSPFVVNGVNNDYLALGFFGTPRQQNPGYYFPFISIPFHRDFINKVINGYDFNGMED